MRRERESDNAGWIALLVATFSAMMVAFVVTSWLESAPTPARAQVAHENPYMKVVMVEPVAGSTVSNTIALSAVVIFSPTQFAVEPRPVQVASLDKVAATPQPRALRASWVPGSAPLGSSNSVVTIYKSSSLGMVWTPFKPTAVTPATRTNTTLTVVSGVTYRFYATLTAQPYGESNPSNTVTNRVE